EPELRCNLVEGTTPLGPHKVAGGPSRSGSGGFPASKINSKKKSGQGLGFRRQASELATTAPPVSHSDGVIISAKRQCGRNKKAAPRRPRAPFPLVIGPHHNHHVFDGDDERDGQNTSESTPRTVVSASAPVAAFSDSRKA